MLTLIDFRSRWHISQGTVAIRLNSGLFYAREYYLDTNSQEFLLRVRSFIPVSIGCVMVGRKLTGDRHEFWCLFAMTCLQDSFDLRSAMVRA